MAITYEWKVVALDKDVATDRATQAHWRVTGTELDFTGSSYGAISIAKYAKDTPYSAINEAMAIAWTKAALGKSQVEATEKSIADQIAGHRNPKTQSTTPWSGE